jgi:benzaldehyde dehydrogenase (NAD)
LARRIPYGVVAVIAPWNFPLILALRSVAPARATGNAVVLKPASATVICCGVAIARLL